MPGAEVVERPWLCIARVFIGRQSTGSHHQPQRTGTVQSIATCDIDELFSLLQRERFAKLDEKYASYRKDTNRSIGCCLLEAS
jgi:hypothetical protein